MKPVLLSHDSEVLLCSVPDEVAEDLEAYCLRFACDWLWHSPEAKNTTSPCAASTASSTIRRTSSTTSTPMSSPTGRAS